MARLDNWRPALIDYIDQQTREPFAYGANDCLLVVAGAVHVMTGVDHAAAYRGRYTTLSGGKRLLGCSPLKFVGGLSEEIHPSRARDGDIGAARSGREFAFGIFIGAHLYVQTESGMGILPRRDAIKAFKV